VIFSGKIYGMRIKKTFTEAFIERSGAEWYCKHILEPDILNERPDTPA
jgi:hypothetical protein